MAKGSQIEAESKLQYYPTDILETYRIMGVLSGRINVVYELEKDFKREFGEENKIEVQRLYLE